MYIQGYINLFLLTVTFQHTTKNTLSADPEVLLRHTSIPATLTLTQTLMSSLLLLCQTTASLAARVSLDGLPDDEPILYQLADVESYCNFIIFCTKREYWWWVCTYWSSQGQSRWPPSGPSILSSCHTSSLRQQASSATED